MRLLWLTISTAKRLSIFNVHWTSACTWWSFIGGSLFMVVEQSFECLLTWIREHVDALVLALLGALEGWIVGQPSTYTSFIELMRLMLVSTFGERVRQHDIPMHPPHGHVSTDTSLFHHL